MAIPFLGIELDSVVLELRLPQDKLQRLKVLLELWREKRSCKKRNLHSLIGLLSHACKVVRAGRVFLCRLIDLSMIPDHLNEEARSDIEWWVRYCESWNGIQMMHTTECTTSAAIVTSDALGLWSLFRHAEMGRPNCGE